MHFYIAFALLSSIINASAAGTPDGAFSSSLTTTSAVGTTTCCWVNSSPTTSLPAPAIITTAWN